MKKMRKLLVVMLTLIMAMAMMVPAMAAGETYTITIENNKDGHTYQAYQVFAGDLSEGVLSNIQWGTGVNGEALLAALKADGTIGSSFTDCTTAAQVAEVLASFESNSTELDAFAAVVGANLSDRATNSGTWNEESKNYTISGLAAGYYFVKDQDGSLTGGTADAYTKFILKLVKDTEVTPKSDVPSVEKKVQEDDKYNQDGGYGQGYNDVADWNIGDAVPFKLIGTIPEMDGYDTYKYIFHDTLSDGLTLNADSVKVYVADSKNADLSSLTSLTAGEDYTLITSPAESHCSFEVSFDDLTTLEEITEQSKYIIVAYTATLNESAEIGLDGNPNEVYLEFSNNPAQSGEGDHETDETPKDEVIVFTYELDTTKVDGADTETTLKDAQFVLLNSDGTKVAKFDAENNKFDGWVDLPTGTDEAITYEDWTTYNETNKVILTSGVDGLFKMIGLDDGTYKLREIKAPDGYNLLPNDVEVVITATTTNGQDWTSGTASEALTALKVKVDNGEEQDGNVSNGTVNINVQNNQGATLPETGGMGTKIFYLAGGILALGAGLLLVTRKRMEMR